MSHNVKDAKGVVICPTLLGQECLKCNRKGHTASYCTFKTVKINKYDDGNESDEQEQTKANIVAQRATVPHVVQAVSFVQAANDFPSLSESLSQNVKHQKSWATVAQTPASNRLVAPKPAAVLKKAIGIPAAASAAASAAAAPVFVPSAHIGLSLTAENLAIMRQSLKKTTCCWADFDEDD